VRSKFTPVNAVDAGKAGTGFQPFPFKFLTWLKTCHAFSGGMDMF